MPTGVARAQTFADLIDLHIANPMLVWGGQPAITPMVLVVAEAMGIDEVTVKAHLGRMLRKTGASNRVELTLRALEEMEADK